MSIHSSLLGRRSILVGALVFASLSAGVRADSPDPAKDLWGGRRTFAATLSAGYQPVVTRSAGTASVRMVLDIATRRVDWEITFSNLTSAPTAIGLHGPAQPGTNGAQLIDLAGKSPRSPVRGSTIVPAGQIQYMLLGWTYVLISTQKYPDGELRGKLDVVSPLKRVDGQPQR
jgi:hypothetical protein